MRALLVALLAACGGGAGADGGSPDADVARTDLVPAVGSDATVDVACWNLREFPDHPLAVARVGDLIASLQLDLVAVEEIDEAGALDAVVARLPGWQAALPTEPGSATGGLGLLWRSEQITAVAFTLELDDDTRFPRPVLRAVADVAGWSEPLALHIVHFKAGTDSTEEQTRVDQAVAVEANARTWAADRLLILGDFNEDTSDPRGDDVFAPWTGDPELYATPTLPLDDSGAITYLPAGVMLDHLIATRALDDRLTEAPVIPALEADLFDYQAVVSDHLPLVVRLH